MDVIRSLKDIIFVARFDKSRFFNSREEEFIIVIWAVLTLERSSVVVADILQKIVLNQILDVGVIGSSNGDPWDIGMSWGKSLSLLSNSVF